MFRGCTSLVEPPVSWYLPAQTIREMSVDNMFSGCSKLQKMAVSYSERMYPSVWSNFLSGVSSTGTFYYSKKQTQTNIQSIVPSGWTLVQSTEW